MTFKPTSGLTVRGVHDQAGRDVFAAPLTTKQRKGMSKSDFVFPDRAPGPGSYPIRDRQHGGLALGFAKGTADYAKVKSAVCSRYPDLPACSS